MGDLILLGGALSMILGWLLLKAGLVGGAAGSVLRHLSIHIGEERAQVAKRIGIFMVFGGFIAMMLVVYLPKILPQVFLANEFKK
jgi:hypothetical protein